MHVCVHACVGLGLCVTARVKTSIVAPPILVISKEGHNNFKFAEMIE